MEHGNDSNMKPSFDENEFQIYIEKYSSKLSDIISRNLVTAYENTITIDEKFKNNLVNIVQSSIKECFGNDDQLGINKRDDQGRKASNKLPYITVNVGGVKYCTTITTLTKYKDSMLEVMFSGKYQPSISNDEYFIDRDGKLFRYILNYLRSDQINLDSNNTVLIKDLIIEAEYFQLKGLIKILTSLLNNSSKTSSKQKLKSKEKKTLKSEYTRTEIHKMKLKHSMSNSKKHLNLVGLNLCGVNFSGLDLSYCDFTRCNLTGASFESANLVGTIFAQAHLQNVNFQQCKFGSTIDDATDFTDSYLDGANFSRFGGVMFRHTLEGADIGSCIGLDEAWLR